MKRIKAITKKLNEIKALQKKMGGGLVPSNEQKEKLGRRAELEQQLKDTRVWMELK